MNRTRNYGPKAQVHEGSIYTWSGNIIENPAMIICIGISGGVLMSWGDRSHVEAKYNDMVARCHSVGCATDDLKFITLDNINMTRTEQCYILWRCIEYTASGFHEKICDKLINCEDVLSRLREEMKRVPIDVEG